MDLVSLAWSIMNVGSATFEIVFARYRRTF